MIRKLFSDYWPGYVVVVAAVFFAIAFSRVLLGGSLSQFFTLPGPDALTLMTTPFLLAIALLVSRLIRRRCKRPLKTILRVMRREKYWLLRTAFVLFCLIPVAQGFGGIKPRIPYIQPFYADPNRELRNDAVLRN
jgi:hypothetical protein